MANQNKSRYPLPVRILALILTILVGGGVVTYLGWLIINLFQH